MGAPFWPAGQLSQQEDAPIRPLQQTGVCSAVEGNKRGKEEEVGRQEGREKRRREEHREREKRKLEWRGRKKQRMAMKKSKKKRKQRV